MEELLREVTHMEAHLKVTGKKSQQWYSVDDEKKILSFCMNKEATHEDGSINNIVEFEEGRAQACTGSNRYIYSRFKKRNREDYKVRLFIKNSEKELFNEVKIIEWEVEDASIVFRFVGDKKEGSE